jgi:hypothetical protein
MDVLKKLDRLKGDRGCLPKIFRKAKRNRREEQRNQLFQARSGGERERFFQCYARDIMIIGAAEILLIHGNLLRFSPGRNDELISDGRLNALATALAV